MNRTGFTNQWLGIIASTLTIVGWLTGLHSIWDLKQLSIGAESPTLGVSFAILVMSQGVIWGAFLVLSTSILLKMKRILIFENLATGVILLFGCALGIILYDVFFHFPPVIIERPDVNSRGDAGPLLPILMFLLLVFILPIAVAIISRIVCFEWPRKRGTRFQN